MLLNELDATGQDGFRGITQHVPPNLEALGEACSL